MAVIETTGMQMTLRAGIPLRLIAFCTMLASAVFMGGIYLGILMIYEGNWIAGPFLIAVSDIIAAVFALASRVIIKDCLSGNVLIVSEHNIYDRRIMYEPIGAHEINSMTLRSNSNGIFSIALLIKKSVATNQSRFRIGCFSHRHDLLLLSIYGLNIPTGRIVDRFRSFAESHGIEMVEGGGSGARTTVTP